MTEPLSPGSPTVCPRCGGDVFNVPRTDAFCTTTRQIESSFVDDMTINCAECGHEMEDERPAIIDDYYEAKRLADAKRMWTPVTERFPQETGQYWLVCQSSRDGRIWLEVGRWDVAHPCPVAWCQRGAAYWIRANGYEGLPDISGDVDALGFKLQGREMPRQTTPVSGVLIGWEPPKEDGS